MRRHYHIRLYAGKLFFGLLSLFLRHPTVRNVLSIHKNYFRISAALRRDSITHRRRFSRRISCFATSLTRQIDADGGHWQKLIIAQG